MAHIQPGGGAPSLSKSLTLGRQSTREHHVKHENSTADNGPFT